MIRLIKIRPHFNTLLIRLLFWALLLGVGTLSYGQTVSTRGNFEVNNVIGCAPLTVTPNTLFSGAAGTTQYFYENTLDPLACVEDYQTNPGDCVNTTNTSDPQFTYTTPGTYYLIQVLGTTPTPEVDFIEITVLAPVAPTFTTALCNNNEVVVTFDFAMDSYDFYEIDFGDGNPPVTFDKTGSNEMSYIYTIQGTYNIEVSGKLSSGTDVNCATASPVTVNTLEVIPTPEITALTVLDESTVELQYTTLTENVLYRLSITSNNSAFTATADIDPSLAPDSFTYTLASPIANSDDLLFQISALEACGVVENMSNIIRNVRTDYNAAYNATDFVLTTTWETSHPNTEIQSVGLFFDGTEESVDNVAAGQNARILPGCLDLRPYYYQVNLNGAFSRSLTITPDLATTTLTPPPISTPTGRLAGSVIILSYDAAPVTTNEYRIYTVNTSGLTLIGTTDALNFTADDFDLNDSEVCFVVSYVDECGFESPVTDQLCFEFAPTLVLPNAFSPNGDRDNDTFGVPPGIYPDFQMQIFNRWGRLIYRSNTPNETWDGTFNGQDAPIGRYVYRINYNFTPNSPVSLTGSVTLIR